ncbi:MAG: pilus assembly protein [Firmicutes bacterium]|nr:pilus assembly protein [Bacillota bacterium]
MLFPTQDEGGQTVMEFAISFPVVLLLAFGILRMSALFSLAAGTRYAAFMGARSAIVHEEQSQEYAHAAARDALLPWKPGLLSPLESWRLGVHASRQDKDVRVSLRYYTGFLPPLPGTTGWRRALGSLPHTSEARVLLRLENDRMYR